MRSTRLGWTALTLLALGACAGAEKQVDTPAQGAIIVQDAAPDPAPISLDLATVDRFVPAEQAAEVVARLRVSVGTMVGGSRPPVNVALAVDTSGSMEGQAIADARSACLAMLGAMSDGDRLAIVTFDSEATVLVPSVELTADSRKTAREQIERMRSRGTTAMAQGLQQALAQLQRHRAADGINRLVLLGDGVPNDPAPLPQLARAAAEQGIGITTLGLGVDYDETLMGQVAQLSGSKFHYIRESSQVAAVLEEEVLAIQRTAARSVQIELLTGPGVQLQEVVGYEVQGNGSRQHVSLGELTEGEERDVIVRLIVPARREGATIELLDARLQVQPASGGGSLEKRAYVAVRATSDAEQLSAGHDGEVERSAARASVASLVLQAIARARRGDLPGAQALVDRAETLAQERGRALDDSQLIARASQMKDLRASLPSLQPAPTPVSQHPGPDAPDRPGSASAPIPPHAAETVREAHSAAVETIQGG